MNNYFEIESFCKNMRNLREANNLSKKEMAHKLNVSVATISNIENGTIPPRLSYIIIVDIYNEFGIIPSQMLNELQNF